MYKYTVIHTQKLVKAHLHQMLKVLYNTQMKKNYIQLKWIKIAKFHNNSKKWNKPKKGWCDCKVWTKINKSRMGLSLGLVALKFHVLGLWTPSFKTEKKKMEYAIIYVFSILNSTKQNKDTCKQRFWEFRFQHTHTNIMSLQL